MSLIPHYEIEERAELLRDTARSLFPIIEGGIRPVSEVPHLSLEMLGIQLQDDPDNRFRIIGRLIALDGSIDAEQQLTLPFNRGVEQPIYSVKRYASDLPLSLVRGDEDVFIGPLMLSGEYQPNGFGVWQLLPKTKGSGNGR